MDVRMPNLDGIEATRQITSSGSTRIIILTTFELDEYVFEALRVGASGFLLKRSPPGELVEAVRVVAAGEALLSPSITRRLIEAFVNQRPASVQPHRVHGLTDREREVLGLIDGVTPVENCPTASSSRTTPLRRM